MTPRMIRRPPAPRPGRKRSVESRHPSGVTPEPLPGDGRNFAPSVHGGDAWVPVGDAVDPALVALCAAHPERAIEALAARCPERDLVAVIGDGVLLTPSDLARLLASPPRGEEGRRARPGSGNS